MIWARHDQHIGVQHAVVATLMIAAAVWTSAVAADDNWPQFRGHKALGIGSGSPPTEWDVASGKNIEWKTAIAGLGHSSPIVWGDRVFLTTAVNSETEAPSLKIGWSGGTGKSADDAGEWTWQVVCLNLNSGEILWTKNAHRGEPVIKRHLKASHANCTSATDGRHVISFFGSEGLFCHDFDGQLIWKRDFGRLHSGPYNDESLQWGFSSSPVIHDGKVIVQCDCLNINFAAVLDIRTGDELLRIDRSGEVATWSPPGIVQTDDGTQIVCNGYKQMAGYDLNTGNRLWHLGNGGDIPVPAPLFANDLIYLTNGHARSHFYAIRPTSRGELTPVKKPTSEESATTTDQPAWWQPKDGSYMPTPLVNGELLYTCNDNGRLTVRDAITGEVIYRKRVGSGSRTYSASAVAANGHLYFCSESGDVTVIAEGREYDQVARNEMNEIIMATPAISGDRLLIRTERNLYCIAKAKDSGEP